MCHSALNIFVKTIWVGPGDGSLWGFSYEEPNWPVIILFSIAVIATIIAISVVLYRIWRAKNCHPIYFAGKVRYARHGDSIQAACEMLGGLECWIDEHKKDLSAHGRIVGLYLDADLTIPLDKKAKVTAPIRIYPKIIK